MGRQRRDGERGLERRGVLLEPFGMASGPHLCSPKSLCAIPMPECYSVHLTLCDCSFVYEHYLLISLVDAAPLLYFQSGLQFKFPLLPNIMMETCLSFEQAVTKVLNLDIYIYIYTAVVGLCLLETESLTVTDYVKQGSHSPWQVLISFGIFG